ncbi:hypothetical protein PG994_005384 [Apiospora phragmitis]|uniref:NB-ARC domain-containing protein n=1 Tax=Apiospora phragmitis TaxID=2905665 RepID=A0ABR1VC62_9PEZI
MNKQGVASQPMPASATKAFQQIHMVKKASPDVHIVLIPDIDTSGSATWGICHEPWRQELVNQSIVIQWYDHGISSSNLSSWDLILEEGGTLLTALCLYQQQHNALSIAGRPDAYGRYSDFLNVIAGIVFLGVPHYLEDANDEQYGERISYLLKANTGPSLNRQILTRLKKDSGIIRDIAMRFCSISLRVGILSIFEKKASKLQDSRFLQKSKKSVVVDCSLSKVGSSLEFQLGLDLDHLEMSLLTDSPHHVPNATVKDCLLSAIKDSVSEIQDRLIRTLSTSMPGPSSSQNPQHGSTTIRPYGSERTDSFVDVQSLLENLNIQQVEPQMPCFMVHTFMRNPEFFGRRDVLARLDECLLPSKELLVASQPDRTRVGVLNGMAGLGKTETAIEFAYSRQHAFDCIFWIRAENSGKLETDIAQIATRLGIQDTSDPHNKTVNKSLALGWLTNPFKIERYGTSSQRTTASWLIIFDNADDLEIIFPYKDIANYGAILITSRDPLSRSTFSTSAVDVELNLFNDVDSGKFLQQITNKRNHDDEAQKIGAKLGGLPIGIAQMGGMICWRGLSFAEFLEVFEEALDETGVLETDTHQLRQSARGNISTIWAIDKLSNEARNILEIVAFLDPDGIQPSLLSERPTALPTSPHHPSRKRLTFYNARRELIRSSLIRLNDNTGDVWAHRVVQHAVRAKMRPERCVEVFCKVVSCVASEWKSPLGAHDPDLWDSMEALYPHVVSLRDIYLRYLRGDFVDQHITLASLLLRASWLLTPSQNPLGQNSNMMIVANETNDAKSCLRHNQRYLEIQLNIQQQSEIPIEKLPRAYNQMGTAWMMVGEYDKAQSSFSSSITGFKALPVYDINMVSIPMANIGLAYWLQGSLNDAAAVLEEGLRDREDIYGFMDTHSFRTGRFLHALGNVYFDQGRTEKSEHLHYKALAQYQSTIGNHHHRTADVCHKVAQHCLRNGGKDQAMRLVDQALQVWSVDKSAYLPEIARTTFLKAKIAMALDRETEAMTLYRKAASLRKRLTSQPKEHDQLSESDFDELVTFWSR